MQRGKMLLPYVKNQEAELKMGNREIAAEQLYLIHRDEIKLYTPDEVQKIFKLSRTQTYSLMNSDGFPTIRINRRMFVEDGELRAWIKNYSGKRYLV